MTYPLSVNITFYRCAISCTACIVMQQIRATVVYKLLYCKPENQAKLTFS